MKTKRRAQQEQVQAVGAEEKVEVGVMDRLRPPPPKLRCEMIEDWNAFLIPEVQAAMANWRPPEDVAAWTELVQQVEEGEAAVWAVGHGNVILGMLIINLPFNDLWPIPCVTHLHVEPGSPPEAKRLLIEVGVAWMKEQGYDSFWSLNVAGLSDEVWERVFRAAGEPIRRGSVYIVKM